MSDYDMTFDKKIMDDKAFDTIFGAEEDNHLLDLILKEDSDAFNIDERDPEAIEDDLGPIGKGDGLGSDVGPDHDAIKTTDDSSDMDILAKSDNNLKGDSQLNISDTTGENVKDGSTVKVDDVHAAGTDEVVGNDPVGCPEHIDDDLEKVTDKTDSFDEAAKHLLEDIDVVPPVDVPAPAPQTPAAPVEQPSNEIPATTPADAPVPSPTVPTTPTAPASDFNNDEVDDMALLDTDPVDDGPVEENAPADNKEEDKPTSVDDLDKEEEKEEVKEATDTVDPADVKDKVDFGGIEDKSGKIGAGDGLGNDIGPDHDAIKTTDDTSDMDILSADDSELKDDQLNVSDSTGEKIKDGGMIKDFDNAGEDGKAASDSFKETSIYDLDEAEMEEDEDIEEVQNNNAKPDFTPSELNTDEDDDILDMLE